MVERFRGERNNNKKKTVHFEYCIHCQGQLFTEPSQIHIIIQDEKDFRSLAHPPPDKAESAPHFVKKNLFLEKKPSKVYHLSG